MSAVWERVRRLEGETLATLQQGKPFTVVEVRDDCVLVRPEDGGGAVRSVRRDRVEHVAGLGLAADELAHRVRQEYPDSRNTSYIAAIVSATTPADAAPPTDPATLNPDEPAGTASGTEPPIAPITRERIDELLRFLPALGTPGPEAEPTWHGLDQKPEGGTFVMPYPTYPPVVEEFFALAAQPCWCDSGYDQTAAGEMVHSGDAIARASLGDIKTMLTYCVRGERFCDGHWGAMVREGRIGAILRRLRHLRDAT